MSRGPLPTVVVAGSQDAAPTYGLGTTAILAKSDLASDSLNAGACVVNSKYSPVRNGFCVTIRNTSPGLGTRCCGGGISVSCRKVNDQLLRAEGNSVAGWPTESP